MSVGSKQSRSKPSERTLRWNFWLHGFLELAVDEPACAALSRGVARGTSLVEMLLDGLLESHEAAQHQQANVA